MTDAEPGRVLGVDLGEARVGVAVSDLGRRLAFPLAVLERVGGTDGSDWEALRAIVAEQGASTVVVGLPLSLDGSRGPAARRALDAIEALRRALPGVEVVPFDERLSTVQAARALRSGRPKRPRRQRVDGAAAAVVLQAWLDWGRG